MKQIVSSAPAKIIITGEHSVVYGEPALLASLDFRCKAKISKLRESVVRLFSNKLDGERKMRIGDVRDYWKGAKKAWDLFDVGGDISDLRKLGRDGYVVMLCSAGLCLEKYDDFAGGINISLKSQLPIISGFGSSAYVAASIIGGVGKLMNKGNGRKELFKLVYEVEKIIHGRPSGGDPAIVINGGFIKFQKQDEKFKFKTLKVEDKTIPEIFILNTGRAKETTGEMVTRVREKLDSNKRKFRGIIRKMGKLSYKFIRQLEKGIFKKEMLQENERCLEELGVVGEKAYEMVCLVEKLGGVAKICGAGGIKRGSGVMLACHDDREKLARLIKTEKWQCFSTKLGGEGWEIE
jgi:mevalonate kinase